MSMNKYLTKLASWKNPSKFLGYVTGARKASAAARLEHVNDFMRDSVGHGDQTAWKNLHNFIESENKNTLKARVVAGAGATGIAVGASLGYKKVRDKQKAETEARYNELLKGAAITKLFREQKAEYVPATATPKNLAKSASASGAAAELGHGAVSGVGRVLRSVGRTTIDLMNTAGGGKIKDRAIRAGMKYNSPEYKAFINASPREKVKHILKKQPTANRKDLTGEFVGLHKHERDAKIAIGTGAVAGVSGYGWHKAREALKKNNPKYY